MAAISEPAPAPASGAPRWRRVLTLWRSPEDQPAWSRPTLLTIAVVAAVAYGWGMAGGAYLMSGTAVGPAVLTAVALVVAVAAVLLLPAAASVNCVISELGPFDPPFETSKTARDSQVLAAAAPALTQATLRLELVTPPGDALFAPTHPGSRRTSSCAAAGRYCRSAASSATCRPRRWPRCGQISAAATYDHSCCRYHRRAQTRGCGGSGSTPPGSAPLPGTPRPRTRTSSAAPPPVRRPDRSSGLIPAPDHPPERDERLLVVTLLQSPVIQPVEVSDGRATTAPRGNCAGPLHRL